MTSPEKAAANRENCKKSTGPKSTEGKARSARNAHTHGLTAEPGDPTEAYQECLEKVMVSGFGAIQKQRPTNFTGNPTQSTQLGEN